MTHFLTMRRGQPGAHQFSPRSVFASFEHAYAAAQRAFGSEGVEYLIEDEHGPITYHLTNERSPALRS